MKVMNTEITPPKTNGFTFIELLVTTVLIILLTTIAIVSYRNAAQASRDARRKKDSDNIRVALEAYKQVYGVYPDESPCASGDADWGYSDCSDDWIVGLEPEYISDLGSDPQQAAGWNGYAYHRVSDTDYELVVFLENENDPLTNGGEYGLSENAYVQEEPK